jgi:hypothetical protein
MSFATKSAAAFPGVDRLRALAMEVGEKPARPMRVIPPSSKAACESGVFGPAFRFPVLKNPVRPGNLPLAFSRRPDLS